MTRRLDIGIASYENAEKLRTTIDRIIEHSVTDWRLLIVDNASPDPEVRKVIDAAAARTSRIVPLYLESNTGYVGAVNEILDWAETTHLAYVDNDCYIRTHGWDEILASKLDAHHELGMAFASEYCAYELQRRSYVETLWGLGCFWMVKRMAQQDVGLFDTELGHQEEVDFQIRLRLAGWKFACVKEVHVEHFASSATNPAAQERINKGVVAWMNKWCAYFGGKDMNYFSDHVLRFEDWAPSALYLENWFRAQGLEHLNDDPEVVTIAGREYDLIKVPRLKNLYRGRII